MRLGNESKIKSGRLIGMRVMNMNSHATGVIKDIRDGLVFIDHHGTMVKYSYPAAFAEFLELEDEDFQERVQEEGAGASFEEFKITYRAAIGKEINYLKATGGKKYKIIDGERFPFRPGVYLYIFDTDSELHFPDDTPIKLWFPEKIIDATIVACEDFNIIIRTMEYIGDDVESVDFTAEQWHLLEALKERVDELVPGKDSLAYEIACNGKRHCSRFQDMQCGQNLAFRRGTSEGITFIWGPPGTGKTEILSNIALEHVEKGKRVLMLSYSNVSVDGALLRVAGKADLPEGKIIRYGYPRTKELLASKTLTSYQYVLNRNPEKSQEYQALMEKRRKLKKNDPERVQVILKLSQIREFFKEEEQELIQNSSFVATTVSKAIVDRAVYMQRFDVVIFDEASMAYVPQIIFSAGLAKKHFVCLGDFRQLPAIVQNGEDDRLSMDIFEYTGITWAVENDGGHDWLVMLDLQHRMHQDIADFVGEMMYRGRLRTAAEIIEGREEMAKSTPCPGAAMSMVDLGGMYSVCKRTMDGSRINILSAMMCLRLAEENIFRYEIGVITQI